MHQNTSTEFKFAAPESTARADAVPTSAQAQSALQLTRAAIARWRGGSSQAAPVARDLPHVSPQARWLAQAQCGLANWIAQGGFAQADEVPLCGPVLYQLPRCARVQADSADACID
jgi:hypothetical protein